MIQVRGSSPADAVTSRPIPRRRATDARVKPVASRALVPVEPVQDAQRAGLTTGRPEAPFLAHLIATREQLPQTRARRRAEPQDVVNHYAAALAARPQPVDLKLKRSA